MALSVHSFNFFCFLALSICTLNDTQAQNLSIQENRLTRLYSDLLRSRDSNNDSTAFYSDKFGKAFKSFVKSNPATLNYPFRQLIDSNFCFITTSADSKLRIYSWDTWTGGTMRYFDRVYQYTADQKVLTTVPKNEEGDPGSFCSKIYTVSIKDKVYYLVISNGIYSSKDASQSISVFTIENNKLVDTAKLFKTKTKRLNRIDVEFDFFSVVDRPERPLELITFDDQKKIINIPVVNDKGQVTRKNIQYQLKDGQFEFIGIDADKRK